jgi:polyferredoxin
MKEKKSRKIIQWALVPLVPLVIIGGYFWPRLGYLPLVMMVIMLFTSLFRGRFYCGWLCAMGAFHERVVARFSLKKKMLPVFKARWFRWLIFILMMSLFAARLGLADGDPDKTGAVFVMMWTLSTGIALALGLIWKPKSWCSFCPMATFQGNVSPCQYLLQVADSCKGCGICHKLCPLETNPGSFKAQGFVKSLDCMRCSTCVLNCPKKALEFKSASKSQCAVLTQLGLRPLLKNEELKSKN